MATSSTDIAELLREFGGDPQQAQGIAEFLGFDPIPSPEDQLGGPPTSGLTQFFRNREDQFGVNELYRIGTRSARPASVGLWVGVLTEWSHRSSDRDRTRRRVARALVEQVPERRNLAILVPPVGDSTREAELIFPRTPVQDSEGSSHQIVTSIRALLDLNEPTRFHRDLLRDLVIPSEATLLDISRRWQQQFSVERVANKFYKEYAEVRNLLADALKASNVSHPIVANLTEAEARAWSTRQMGRVLFLWFLQAKRWLGAPGGNGSPSYLRDLWRRRSETPEQEYYRGLLLPLFFDAMATGSSSAGENSLLGYVPYLNGGLFRRNGLEDRIDDAGAVSLPDDVFDPERDDSLLGLLSHYRFTTRESTPDDQSVDPDPELLGRVFENLYQGDERHDTGTYYTPREIVHFMCREALDGYLMDEVPGLEYETLETIRVRATGSQDESETGVLDSAVADGLIDALETVKVCDPAVGSGAFLLGIMQEMILLHRGILFSRRDDIEPDELYDMISGWKRRIITNNLHGVDINAEAVEICRLRLWLSMVLDIAEPPHPNEDWALPNLDFRIAAGDSLVDRAGDIAFKESWPTPKALQIGLDLQNQLGRLERTIARRKEEFDRTHRNPQRLRELRDLIDRDQREVIHLHLTDALLKAQEYLRLRIGIKRGKNSEKRAQQRVDRLQSLLDSVEESDFALVQKPFLWPLAFPEVLREGDGHSGFDIVLANPPYVRQEKLDPIDQEIYAESFPEVHVGTADLLVYFYARAVNLLRPGGWASFITSNSFTKRKYGEKLRGYLPNQLAIKTLIDFGEVKIFDAVVEPYVLVGQKTTSDVASTVKGHNLYPVLARQLGRNANVARVREGLLQLPEFLEIEKSVFEQSWLGQSDWRIEDNVVHQLFARLMAQGMPLGGFANGRVYRGIITGLNEAFVIGQSKFADLVEEDPRSADIIKPWLRGQDIRRWKPNWDGQYAIVMQNSGDSGVNHPWSGAISEASAKAIFRDAYPAVHDYLAFFERRLINRQDQGKFWWELRPCTYYHELSQAKIIWPDIAREVRFAYETEGKFMGNTCYTIPSSEEWLVAVLNSDFAEFLLCQMTNSLRGGFMRLFPQYVEHFPVVTPNDQLRSRLESVTQAGLSGDPVDDDALNEMVYQMYGLSDREVGLVNDWFARRSLVTASDK